MLTTQTNNGNMVVVEKDPQKNNRPPEPEKEHKMKKSLKRDLTEIAKKHLH